MGAQSSLIKAITSTGVPTIVVLSTGKPITEPWLSDNASALIQQFYPSEEGGHALADVLFGAYNPSGKLSVSFPRNVGSLPIYYDYLNSARTIGDSGMEYENGTMQFGHQYVLGSPRAWYPFGHGKSYSRFRYENVNVSKENVTAEETVVVSVDVTNESRREGTEVVQVYIRDEYASVVVPNRVLKGFEKVVIKAGETRSVNIPIQVKELGVWDVRMKYVVEPGRFVALVGSSSEDVRGNATFWVR